MRIHAVIGAGYGDEGKGLSVDALSRELSKNGDVTVIRVNGGAQAGHTVQVGDVRHVFHQFAAGSLAGSATHWSKDFVATPSFWAREREELDRIGGRVDAVSADPRVQVTTPWDILINQSIEAARNKGRHGSCGMGFGETIERAERGWGLSLGDLTRSDAIERVRMIREFWFPKRMMEHGLDPEPFANVAMSDALLSEFLADAATIMRSIRLLPDAELGERAGSLITEGAQGLGLDMEVGAFPHVTRSRTGLFNVVRFAQEVGADGIDAIYATRAYGTRHGAGPFPGEGDVSDWANVVDPTNAPNDWQGALRTGALDLDLIRERMDKDAACVAGSLEIRRQLNVTCLDQLTGAARLKINGDLVEEADVSRAIATCLDADLVMSSCGPTAKTVDFVRQDAITPTP